MESPKEDDIITNSDESKRLPDENPEPLTGTKMDETGTEDRASKGGKEENSEATKRAEGLPKPESKDSSAPQPEK
ncbi:hypothetical protein [Pontibacter litorisediminis]|uniref:hypothetical protein n=1 Tax=Pontibacter litorisediminis TaxID=1846260 RepID=UPI0023ECFE40|nr:hypothetical protein [Pontibacter litorisediminis]